MGNMLICAPNFIEGEYTPPIFLGGNWTEADYLDNLTSQFFIDQAISTDVNETSTQFEVDLQTARDIKFIGIPNSNVSRPGRIRTRGASQAAWFNVTVNGAFSSGATSISVTAAIGANIRSGQGFTLPGDDTVYQVTSDLSLGQNLIKDSEGFNSANWTKNNATVVANYAVAPNGAQTADRLVDDTTNNDHEVVQNVIGVMANETVDVVIHVKADTLEHGRLQFLNKDNTELNAWFSFGDTPSADNKSAGVVNSIETVNEGYVRCRALFPAGSGGTTPQVRFLLADAQNGSTYTGTGAGAVVIWGLRVKRGVVDTPYVRTGSTAVDTLTGTITIKRNDNSGTGLAISLSGGEALTCRSGDYVRSAVFNEGFEDYMPVIYPVGQAVWGSAAVWDGKETPENISILSLPNQYSKILSTFALARFVSIEVSDTNNVAGFVSIDGLYVTSAYRPLRNMSYGARIGFISNTTGEKSVGGAAVFHKEKIQRFVEFSLENIPLEEAFVNVFDLQRRLDISENLFFIYDEDDTTLITRRSFPGRFVDLGALQATFYNLEAITVRIEEKLA